MITLDPKDYTVSMEATTNDVDLDQEKIYFRGERLTEKRAEQLAETAFAEARRRGLIPRRKSLSGWQCLFATSRSAGT
jgi:hypothetical protein